MAQYPKIGSIGSIGSIILAILEVQVCLRELAKQQVLRPRSKGNLDFTDTETKDHNRFIIEPPRLTIEFKYTDVARQLQAVEIPKRTKSTTQQYLEAHGTQELLTTALITRLTVSLTGLIELSPCTSSVISSATSGY